MIQPRMHQVHQVVVVAKPILLQHSMVCPTPLSYLVERGGELLPCSLACNSHQQAETPIVQPLVGDDMHVWHVVGLRLHVRFLTIRIIIEGLHIVIVPH